MEKSTCSKYSSMLNEYWDKGMKSLSSMKDKEMAAEVMSATGLSYKQLKNWLGDRRRMEAGKPRSATKSKLAMRQKSGRDVYFKKVLSEKNDLTMGEKLSKAAAEWRMLKDTNEGSKYVEEAKAIPVVNPVDLDGDELQQFVKRKISKLNEIMASLKAAGVEVLCLMYSSKEGTVYDIGTDKGTSFASKRADFVTSFISFVSDNSVQKSLSLQDLRHQVMTLMDEKFREVTGQRRCSYEAIKKGSMTLEGLPLDINFTNPWMAGKRTLERILELKEKIYFKRCSITQPVHDDDCLPPPAVLSGESADTCDYVTQPSAVFTTTFLLPAAVQQSPAVDEQDQSTTPATESVTASAAAESDCLRTFAIADEVQHECIPAKKCRNEKPGMAAGESKSKKVRTMDGGNRCTRRKKTAKENTVSAVKCYECGIVENSRADFNLRQDWIQCCKPGCGMWCHESCGETGGLVNELFFVCSKCSVIE